MKRLTSIGVALLMTASVSVATSAATNTATDTAHTKVKEKLTKEEKVLAKGKTKVVKFKDDKGKVKYAATVGVDAEVNVVDTGNEGLYELSVEPRDPTTDAEAEAMAAELTAEIIAERTSTPSDLTASEEGTSTEPAPEQSVGANRAAPKLTGVEATVPKAGAGSGSSAIYDVGCLYITTEVYAKGCFYRRMVPESMAYYYLKADSSDLYGHHSGTWGRLTGLRSIHDFDTGAAGTEVVESRPAVTRDGNGCADINIGIEYGVFKASMPVALCPDKLDPYARATYFRHAWYGSVSKDSTDRETVGHSITKGRNGYGIGFDYRIQADECDHDWAPWDPNGMDCDWRTAG